VKEARAFGPAEPVPAPDKHRPASDADFFYSLPSPVFPPRS
jgi:hypothetical protein